MNNPNREEETEHLTPEEEAGLQWQDDRMELYGWTKEHAAQEWERQHGHKQSNILRPSFRDIE